MAQEMGKPVTQGEGEVDKCISHLQYYIDNTEQFLENEELKLANKNNSGIIKHQPLGPTLGKYCLHSLQFDHFSSYHALELPLLGAIQVFRSTYGYGKLDHYEA